jgi:lambda repressor-like predicted transcriptional regulator
MYDDAFRHQVLSEHASGRSLADVSREFGVQRATVRAWLARPHAMVPAHCIRCADASPTKGAA